MKTFNLCILFTLLFSQKILSQSHLNLVDETFIQICQCKKYEVKFPNTTMYSIAYSNEKGNTIKREEYHDGKLNKVDSFYYNPNNLLVAYATFYYYDSTLNFIEAFSYKYTQDSTLKEIIRYSREGKPEYKTIYNRDEKNRIKEIREFYIDNDSSILKGIVKTNVVNDSVQKFEYKEHNKTKYTGVWKYNSANQLIFESVINKQKIEIINYKFKYDSNGNISLINKVFEKDAAFIYYLPHYMRLFWPTNYFHLKYDNKNRIVKVLSESKDKKQKPSFYNIQYFD